MRQNLIALVALVLTCAGVQAASLNDLYFGLDNMRGFSEVYWWFLADGRVLEGLPTSGITPADFEKACAASPAICGNYTLSGSNLAIKFRNGRTENFTYKPLNGGMQLNYLILTPVTKYPAGARLNGTWDRPFSSTVATGSAVTNIVVPRWITFKPDGTYSEKTVAGVDTQTAHGGVTSSHQTDVTGSYTIQANVLTLVKNGRSERHMIFPVAGDNLNIDGQVFHKQK